MRMRAASSRVPSMRAASSATAPSARRTASAGASSPRTGVPSPASAELCPRAGVRQPAVDHGHRGARRRGAGDRRLHAARRSPRAARAPRRRRARVTRCGAGSSCARTSHRPRSSGVTSVSTRRRQRSRSVLTRSSAGRPPSQYHHSAPLASGSANSSGRSRARSGSLHNHIIRRQPVTGRADRLRPSPRHVRPPLPPGERARRPRALRRALRARARAGLARSHRGARPRAQRVRRRLRRRRPGRGRRGRARRRAPVRRRADRDQEQPRDRRQAADLRRRVLRRLGGALRPQRRPAPQGGGLRGRGLDHPARVGHPAVDQHQALRADAQPVGPGAHERRLLGRLGHGGRRRHGAHRPRQRRRRLDAHPGRVLRARRPQAPARPHLAGARHRGELPGHRRGAHAHRAGHRAGPRRAGRAPRSATRRGRRRRPSPSPPPRRASRPALRVAVVTNAPIDVPLDPARVEAAQRRGPPARVARPPRRGGAGAVARGHPAAGLHRALRAARHAADRLRPPGRTAASRPRRRWSR